ncbi:MerR family transcriptional regulator [Kibdelosporangium lantanae]
MLGMPASTLRSWHRRYPIRLGQDVPGRHRRYTTDDVTALERMRNLVTSGMAPESAARLVFARPTESEAVTASMLVAAAGKADTLAVTALLDAAFASYGVTTTWDLICRPALCHFGDTCVDVVHHLSSAIIIALHRIPQGPSVSRANPALLACVDGERHTLPLEALHAALAEQGIPARMLGASVPVFALRDAIHRSPTSPPAVVLWAQNDSGVDAYLDIHSRLVLGGPGWPQQGSRPSNLTEAVNLLRGWSTHVPAGDRPALGTLQQSKPVLDPGRDDLTFGEHPR